MKRVGNLYEKIYDLENLEKAHKNARKGKTWYEQVKCVDENVNGYLLKLHIDLVLGTYQTSPYETFELFDKNKMRTIYKLPYYPDRICQWAILQIIEPYLLKTLTNDTYSAIPKRGIHLALKRLKNVVKNDVENTKYCLKLDISKYYPSIDQEILIKKLNRIFKDRRLLNLLEEIIHSVPKGIPIGNYLSQWFGNFYLGEFAHWLKEEKKVKHLFIYMDDIVILSGSKTELHTLFKEIELYLNKNLKLTVKPNWQVFPVDVRGIDFVGYRVFRHYTLLRKSTYKNLRRKSNYVRYKIDNNIPLTHNDYCSINSYCGWLKYGNCYNLKRKYIYTVKQELDEFHKNEVKK